MYVGGDTKQENAKSPAELKEKLQVCVDAIVEVLRDNKMVVEPNKKKFIILITN